MTCYLVGRIAIHDPERYGRYAAAFLPVLKQYGGRLLVSEERPEPLEGEWDGRKLVLLAFEDGRAARRWADSPEYRRIAEDRIAGRRRHRRDGGRLRLAQQQLAIDPYGRQEVGIVADDQ
ncbi:DUF1330 domain-containing protein [Phenylobacterium sp. J367]|uniref:DUF1330 domain-containing protein n=1 Tax=Phenylobacterium sp. J367 TaxID=2898435 RepID=UPI002150A274|nr:DUF1330 domain-containing protein [Phenylobacterium sp. J367]MCR5879928.1 DUF1330 domain-containing protein [Phenylobacterium sp. J367]